MCRSSATPPPVAVEYDVDDPPPVQTLSRSRGDLEQTGEALGSDDRTEPSGIERLELDVQRGYVNEDGSPDSSPPLSADDPKIRLRERCVVTTLLLRAKSRYPGVRTYVRDLPRPPAR